MTTIGQAYYCVFAHYYAGPVLDDRVLLAGAFAGFTQELDRLGMDQPDATMPALTGNRDRDWAAFAAVYQKVTSQLPASPAQRQELAAATMTAMIASLDNNHARWSYPAPPPRDVPGDLGILTSPAPYAGIHRPDGATITDKMLFMVAAMAAEMERDLIRERTLDGLRAAEAQGRRGGRPAAVNDDVLAVARARQSRGESVTAIARHLKIGRSTLYRALQPHEADLATAAVELAR